MAATMTQEEKEIQLWRLAAFEDLGFEETTAALLASTRIDTHRMEGLLAQGCPHDTAMGILMGTDFTGRDDPAWREPMAFEEEAAAA
jgi:hypothetical protein